MKTPRSLFSLVSTLAGAAVVSALLVVGSPATAAAEEVQWSVTPADRDGPDGRVSLRHVVEPGESVRDRIAVTNLGSRRATFSVLPGDGMLGTDGAFDIAPGAPEAAGRWVSVGGLEDNEVSVGAGQTRVLAVDVEVPSNATPGDQPVGVVVARSGGADGVTVTHRIGVRLHLQVAGDLQPALEVSDVDSSFAPSSVPFAPGTLTVTYRVENTGNVRLGAGVEVSAGLPFGLLGRSAATTQDELLPGDETTMSTQVRAWPTVLSTGSVRVQGTAVGEDVVQDLPEVEQGVWSLAISWTGMALLVLIALLWWRRRRAARPVPSPTVSADAAGATVERTPV